MLFKSRRKKVDVRENKQSTDDNVFDLENDVFGDDFEFNKVTMGGKTRDFGRGLARGVLSKGSRKQMMRGLLTGLLPEEYNHIITAGESAWDAVRSNIERAQEENSTQLLSLTSKAEQNIHKIKNRLPAGAYTRLEKHLEKKRAYFEDRVKQREGTLRSGSSKTDDESNLAAVLSDTFAAAEAMRSHDEQELNLRREMLDTLQQQEEKVRFNASLEVLSGMRDDISKQTSFQDTFVMRYQKKMLEVSYRSYFALRDIRRLAAVGLDFNRVASESIIHNTGLPDSQKAANAITRIDSSQIRDTIRETGIVRDSFSYMDQIKRLSTREAFKKSKGILANYQAQFWPRVAESIQANIRDTLMGMDMAGSMSGGFNPADMPPELLGEVSGEAMSSFMGRYIMPRLAQRFSPQMQTLSQRLNGRNYLAQYAVNNATSLLQDFAHNIGEDDSKITGILRGFARAHFPEYRLDDKLSKASYKSIDKAVSFNNLSQRSLVEIIPGLLSRILQVNRQMLTGDMSIGREVYDITKGEFTDVGSARGRLKTRIVSERQRENIRTTISDVMDNMQGDSPMSDEAQYALRDRMMKDAATNGRFDPEKYITGEGFGDVTDQTRQELIDFFKNTFDFDSDGKLVQEYDNLRRLNAFSDEFLRIRDVIPNAKDEIERIHTTGSQELLREMGIVYTDHGQDYINYEKLWEMYRGDDNEGIDPSGGPAPIDPEEEDDQEKEKKSKFDQFVNKKLDDLENKIGGKKDTSDKSFNPPWEKKTKESSNAKAEEYQFPWEVEGREDDWDKDIPIENEDAPPVTDIKDRKKAKERRFSHLSYTHGSGPLAAARGFELKGRVYEKLKDLYDRFGKRLLLKRDLVNAEYIDVNTGKTIESFEDITGPVVDQNGDFIITQEEYDAGLYDVEGRVEKPAERDNVFNTTSPDDATKGSAFQRQQEELKKRHQQFKDAKERVTSSQMFKSLKERLERGNMDAYMPGEEEPRLTMANMRRGLYTTHRGKIIRHWNDVDNHSIFDTDMNVVVHYTELDKLVDPFGNKHLIARNQSILGNARRISSNLVRNYVDGTIDYYKKLPGRMVRASKFVFDKTAGVAGRKMGIFKPKEREELTEEEIQNRRSKGRKASFYNPLKRGQQEWDAFDAENEDVQPNAGNTQGEPQPGGTAFKASKRGFMGRAFRWMRDPEREVNEESITTPTDALLNRINDNLEAQKPEDVREGSWQQILAEREANANKEGDGDATKGEYKTVGEQFSSVFGGLKSIIGAIGGLFGLGGAASGVGDLAGGLGDLLGGSGGNQGGGNNSGGNRGWFKRTWDGILGRDGGTRTGRMLRYGGVGLGYLGRGALVLGSSTVGLGATAAVTAAAGGYYLWRRHQQTAGRLYRVRFRQYGIDPTDRDTALPVLNLEVALESVTTRDGEGKVDVDPNRLDLSQLLGDFNVPPNDQNAVNKFITWFNGRFMPVYIKHQSALGKMGVTYALTRIDDDIIGEHAIEFIELVRSTDPEVLAVVTSPFGNMERLASADIYIEEAIQEAIDHYESETRTHGNRQQRTIMAQYGLIDEDEVDPNQVEETTSETTTQYGTLHQHMEKLGGEFTARSNVSQQARQRTLSFLQKLRGYAYGLSHFDDDYMDGILTLEDAAIQHIKFTSDGQAEFDGSADQLLRDNSEKLGIVWSHRHPQVRVWRRWFNERFITVLLAYAGKARQLDRSVRLNGTGQQMTKSHQLQVARSIIAAKKEGWFIDTAIWDIDVGDFTGHDRSQSLLLAEDLVREFAASERAAATPRNPVPKPEADDGMEVEQNALTQRDNSYESQVRGYYEGVVPSSVGTNGGYGTAGIEIPRAPGGAPGGHGAVYGGLLEGTGGAFEEVAFPNQNRSREAAMATLRDVEKMTGVNADLLATFAKIESNFDYMVKAPTSSATGWFQFLNGTWDAVVEKYGSKYGIPTNLPQAERREMRKDPRINALMGAELLKENFTALERRIGRTPTDADLYLAHFLGAPRATAVLSSPDVNTVAAHAYPDAASANPSVFYRNGRPLTVGEIIQWADSKVAPGRTGNTSAQSVSSHHTPDEAVVPSEPRSTVDMSGVDAYMNEAIRRNSAPASQGPTNFDMYGGVDTGNNPEIGEERYRRAMAGTQGNDPYGTRPTIDPVMPAIRTSDDLVSVDRQRQQRVEELHQQERSRNERMQQERVETQAIGTIAQQQLEQQVKMVGYLETIAKSLGVDEPSRPSNDTSVPPTPSEQTTPNNTRQQPQPRTGATLYSERERAGVSMQRS